jgi:hypothetical protein
MVQEAAYKRGRPEDGDDQPSPKRQAAENGTAADGSEEQEEYEVDSDDNEEEDSSDVDQEYAWLRAQLRADGAAGRQPEATRCVQRKRGCRAGHTLLTAAVRMDSLRTVPPADPAGQSPNPLYSTQHVVDTMSCRALAGHKPDLGLLVQM